MRWGAGRTAMLKSKRLKITDLNPHLSCILCGGYFIDATTITECLHSFCRACIVRYLETSKYCPVCEVQVHKSRPLHYIRSDKTLQDIVYKLVPGLFHNEMKRRRELYASQPPEALKESRDAEYRGECLDEKFIYASDEIFSLSIEFGCEENQSASSDDADDLAPKRRFLRCPAAITVGHLKKFIRMKYGIPAAYEIDLRYDKDSLLDDYSLMDVAYIFLWQRKGPMRFKYRIMERPPRRIETLSNPIKQDVEEDNTLDVLKAEVKPEVEQESSTDVIIQQIVPEDCPDIKQDGGATTTDSGMDVIVEDPKHEPKLEVQKEPKEESTKKKPPPDEKIDKKDTSEPPENANVSSKKDSKLNMFKFPSSSLHKSLSSDNKPVVMTVAPLTKTSASEPTACTTSSTGTVTHGLYTGISIKKSPPNTLPPFRISSHLLPPTPPRVPPLKLSPRFSRLEYCLRQMSPKETSSYKKSSSSKKSKSSRSSLDKLESKVAQLKSASIKSVAPLVISVPSESKVTERKAVPEPPLVEKKTDESKVTVNETVSSDETKSSYDDDKMDLDNDLFEGPLVIAEPDIVSKEDSDSSNGKLPDINSKEDAKEDDPEDEEIDVVDDIEVDSGRGSDSSSRAEARSLCGDDDLGSPDSVPKTPESDRQPTVSLQSICQLTSETKSVSAKCNGVSSRLGNSTSPMTNGGDCGVLDLSKCSRKRAHEPDSPVQRSKPNVANPAVLDKNRQTTSCPKPDHPSFKDASTVLPHVNIFKSKSEPSPNFKCIIPPTNGNRQKIVIKNLGPSPNRLPDRFHHHHHHSHHHHHQRM